MKSILDSIPGLTVDLPTTVKLASPVVMASLAFFNVHVFTALLVMLVIDIVSGLYKAKVLGKMNSRFFGNSFNRMVYYTTIYVVLHILTLSIPLGMFAALPESIVMTGYLLKEALSVLENVKAIQTAKGYETPLIDKLITRLGMDIDKISNEILNSTLLQQRLVSQAEEAYQAEETPAEEVPVEAASQGQGD